MYPVTCIGPCIAVALERYCYYFYYVFCQKSEINLLLCMEINLLLYMVMKHDLSLFIRYHKMMAIIAASQVVVQINGLVLLLEDDKWTSSKKED